jgi:hypothetical protein
MNRARLWYFRILMTAVVVLWMQMPAGATSTGGLSGTVSDEKGTLISGAHVSALAGTGSYRATTDQHGFYIILNLPPDTYTVTFSAEGYDSAAVNGVTVFQGQTLVVNGAVHMHVTTLGHVTTTASKTNLVQPNVTSNTYNITAAQQHAILSDSTHHTLYDVLWRSPGVTSGPTNGSPIIRGGINTELGWEFDEIPIVDRTVGYYVTELSTTGIGNVELTTGGLSADQGGSNGGIVNMVVKQGTYPGHAWVNFSIGTPAYDHGLDFEIGGASPNNKFSYFVAGSYIYNDQLYGSDFGKTFFPENVEGFDYVNTHDTMINFHQRWGESNQNDIQYLADVGVGLFRTSYGGVQGQQLALTGLGPGGAFILTRKSNADVWYHWYNIQKVSFSHTINDRSYFRARIAQSRNGYFFDELWAANIGEPCINYGTFPFGVISGCTLQPGLDPSFNFWGYGIYYQDRHQLGTFANFDYVNQIGEHHQLRLGVGDEWDNNYRAVADPTSTDFNGSWPDYYRVTKAPTHLYGTYLSDHYAAGKWVVEPGVRWDLERYSITPVRGADGTPAAGTAYPFSESFVSPRVALTYQSDPSNVFRASYSHLGQFIGTAYAENYSPDAFNNVGPYFRQFKPQVAKSYDLSWEHQFPASVSLRITPYAHNNDDYVVELRSFPVGGTSRRVFFQNGGVTHTKGVEMGLSREVSQGLSTFFSFTYNDTKTNVISLAGPYFGSSSNNDLVRANILAKNFIPAAYAAPWSSNLALDWKQRDWEIVSNTTWSTAFPYGNGRVYYNIAGGVPVIQPNPGTCIATNQGQQCLSSAEAPNSFANSLKGPAWYNQNLSISHRIGTGWVGVTATNLFDYTRNPTLSTNGYYLNTDASGNFQPLTPCPSTATQLFPCYNTVYPAPNMVRYPANGYFAQTSLPPRQVMFWYKLNLL